VSCLTGLGWALRLTIKDRPMGHRICWIAAALCLGGCGAKDKYQPAAWAGPVSDNSYAPGRGAEQIQYIILHTTEHSASAAQSLWLGGHGVSGHYLVTTEGFVRQFVRDNDTAFHAGNLRYNRRSIGIAVEGFADPANRENPAKDCSWQTATQFDALATLIRRLTDKYAIPIDRMHIIGKNQVPSYNEKVEELDERNWGGATNKYAPGSTWNWTALMRRLGREPRFREIEVVRRAEITTLPYDHAPIVSYAWPQQRFISYDEGYGHILVFVAGFSRNQPNLPPGDYHWDGWLREDAVRVTEHPQSKWLTGEFPQPMRIEVRRPGAAVPDMYLIQGKLLPGKAAPLGGPGGSSQYEVDLVDPFEPYTGLVRAATQE
jgi:N-acetyl-anhydromuramyl-L-alanine amidase AmpD